MPSSKKSSSSTGAKKQPRAAAAAAAPAQQDARFANIASDPRFSLPSQRHQKVGLDRRFRRLLEDDAFAQKATVDRYGRRLGAGSGRRALERFYRLEEDALDGKAMGEEDDEDEDDDNSDEEGNLAKADTHTTRQEIYDPARQGGFDSSSSEESDSEDDESDSDDESLDNLEDGVDVDEEALVRQTAGSEARGPIPEGEVTTRLAVVNMDWDKIRAVDLMAVAQSFCPVGARLLSCSVYLSDFGRERMEREELEGPPKELFTAKKSKKKKSRRQKRGADDDESQDSSEDDAEMDARIRRELLQDATEGNAEVDSRALRSYQLSRLQYYYAIMTFDNKGTAHAVYNAMDGREYLASANFFDLRFVPDETTFDDEARDECTRVPAGYRPSDFVTEALTHSKVKLTWDADDVERKEVQKRAFGRHEIDENDLKAYVGSDSSEDDDQDAGRNTDAVEVVDGTTGEKTAEPKLSKAEEARRKMRRALGLSVEEAPSTKAKGHKKDEPVVGDMQITFTAGLSSSKPGKDSKTGVFENKPEDVREETTVEKYRRKEKERRARRKEKMRAARNGEALPSTTAETTAPDELDIQSSASEAGDEILLDDSAAGQHDEQDEDDPFNDPFFTDPAAANAAARKASKAAKRKAAQEAADKEAVDKAAERAQLEALMAADRAENGVSAADHFDMAAIRKAEKASERSKKDKWAKKKKKKQGASDGDAGNTQQTFELDTQDPRFRGVFDDHEFAIDPSNPRYTDTRAMRQLLEEGRRKRKGALDDGGDYDDDDKPQKQHGRTTAAAKKRRA